MQKFFKTFKTYEVVQSSIEQKGGIDLNDDDIKRMISTAMACLPVPWEQLWAVFQKIIQQSQKPRDPDDTGQRIPFIKLLEKRKEKSHEPEFKRVYSAK